MLVPTVRSSENAEYFSQHITPLDATIGDLMLAKNQTVIRVTDSMGYGYGYLTRRRSRHFYHHYLPFLVPVLGSPPYEWSVCVLGETLLRRRSLVLEIYGWIRRYLIRRLWKCCLVGSGRMDTPLQNSCCISDFLTLFTYLTNRIFKGLYTNQDGSLVQS